MPMYEYKCSKCNHQFEKLAKSMSSTDAVECPKCGSKKTDRALSVFAVSSQSGSQSAGSGECCPCGKNRGACSMN